MTNFIMFKYVLRIMWPGCFEMFQSSFRNICDSRSRRRAEASALRQPSLALILHMFDSYSSSLSQMLVYGMNTNTLM